MKKIEIQVSEENEGTSFPWWCIVVKPYHPMNIEGPFFSREEAEEERQRGIYKYGKSSKVWCLSGVNTRQYRDALGKEFE